jgi:hypothetical protein
LKVTKREHIVYTEYHKIPEEKRLESQLPCMMGQWQYIYETDKATISLVELFGYNFDDPTDFKTPIWEIYCLKGDLFDDVERFKTKELADKRIRELLQDG